MEPETYVELIDDRSQALLRAARSAPDAPVAACPGWTVADVLRHCGAVWGWAAATVRGGSRADFDPEAAPQGGDELLEWAGAQAADLVDALRHADPEAPSWTFGPTRTTSFWYRRQALEAALHAWDAEAAVGTPGELAPEVGADGLGEFLQVAVSRQVERDPGRWNGESVHFHQSDGGGEWLVRLGPEGAFSVEEAHGKGDLAVRGPAADLFLWATNRAGPERLEFFGDLGLAERWRREIKF